jgi:predicted site-specific integrase-resolvase
VWYNNSTTEGESKPKGKRKKLKKLFKNLLTNSTKYGIIKIPKRESKAKRSRKKLKNFRKTP